MDSEKSSETPVNNIGTGNIYANDKKKPFKLIILFSSLAITLGVVGFILVLNQSLNSPYNSDILSDGGSLNVSEIDASEFDAASAVQRCLALQYGKTETNPEATECFRESLYLAVKLDQFDKVFAIQPQINQSGAYGPCHSGAHLAGVDLVRDKKMHEILPVLFREVVPGKDSVCTTGLVHGLVQGSALGEPPFDLQYLADQCIKIQELKPDYASECSHYFGHVAYKNYKTLDDKVAKACELLLARDESGMTSSCVGGALMQQLSLQDDTYNPTAMDTELVSMNPPQYSESITLCEAYDSYPNDLILKSCWGGIGWLLAMRTSNELDRLSSQDLENITKEYVSGINYCKFDDCVWTYLLHLRPADYPTPAAEKLCADPGVMVETETHSFKDICEYVVALRNESPLSSTNPFYDQVYW